MSRRLSFTLLALPVAIFAAGTGTKDDPLTISSVEEFVQFRDAVNDSSEYGGVKLVDGAKGLWFSLKSDIDLSSVCGKGVGSWTPIGPFAGSFNGGGHTISNLYMDETYLKSVGVFGQLFGGEDTLVIKDVHLADFTMNFETETIYGGAVASQAVMGNIVISDVIVENLNFTLKGDGVLTNGFSAMIGGVIGNTVATSLEISNSNISGSITSTDGETDIGGIMGAAPSPVILHDNEVDVDIKVVNSDGGFGGLVGEMVSKFDISGNVSKGDIKADSLKGYSYVGGIFGVNPFASMGDVLENCKNTGKIEASGTELAVGGIAGFLSGNAQVKISNVTNEGEVVVAALGTGSEPIVGGVAGIYDVETAEGFVNQANITVKNASTTYAGGIGGYIRDLQDSVTLKECENHGDIVIQNDNEDEDDWTVYAAGIIGNAGEAKAVAIEGRNVADGEINVSGKALLREAFVSTIVYVKGPVPVIALDDVIDHVELNVKELSPKKSAGDDEDKGSGDDGENGKSAVAQGFAFDVLPLAYRVNRTPFGWNVEFIRNEAVSDVKILDLRGKRLNAAVTKNARGFDIAGVPVNGAYIISIETKNGVRNIKVN